MTTDKMKRQFILTLPYIPVALLGTKIGMAWRLATGADISAKTLSFITDIGSAFQNLTPSLEPHDMVVGIFIALILRLAVYIKSKNAKKFRKDMEYGSARWGTREDIKPFIDPVFKNNVILTKTERLTMSSRPKDPKYARNKNVLIIGGSGSGKTRFVLTPNILQAHSSYVITDPKGGLLLDCGSFLQRENYEIRILNVINFKKSHHYNPFHYIHSEKDILKLVNTLISNTKGDGKSSDPFWEKAETLLYTALIGYIHYILPKSEQNFNTLVAMINAMEVREDDESFINPVDSLFNELQTEQPEHFAVRQYLKYKLAAGVVCYKRLIRQVRVSLLFTSCHKHGKEMMKNGV